MGHYRPGSILVKRLPQLEFNAPTPKFDSGRFNLHHVPQGGSPPTLVILVHGLGGRGYESWGQLPYRLFSGADGPAVDVGVYDYRSGLRDVGRRFSKFQFWVKQLSGNLRQVEADYSNIVLVGHSLGGLLVEAVAKDYLETRAMQHEEAPGCLAALVVVASPRAGSGWAVPLFARIVPEIAILRRFAPSSADVDEFFATHIERHNFAVTAPRLRILPVYAVIGGRDKLVSGFSATFGVPKEQRLYLEAGHSSMHKDDQLIDWLHRVIADRLEVRAQAAREQQHAAYHVAATVADPHPAVVTRFVSDSSGLLWEELYNEVRRDATTTTVVVQDVRDTPGADVDLLIAVHDAGLVVAANPAVRNSIFLARAERERHLLMSVGICPVGAEFDKAETTVHQWLAEWPPTTSVYVEGAADAAGLRAILGRLLQLVIGRNPRRVALADPGLGGPDDVYDPKRGGF